MLWGEVQGLSVSGFVLGKQENYLGVMFQVSETCCSRKLCRGK